MDKDRELFVKYMMRGLTGQPMKWEELADKSKIKYATRWVQNWFSNMAPSEFELDGKTWKSVENYYQAMKSTNPIVQEQIRQATISHSKQLGRKVENLREDWDDYKFDVMYKALRAKFSLEPHKTQLLETGYEVLVEWNNWNDRIWGVDVRTNVGDNYLGSLLMQIREEIIKLFKTINYEYYIIKYN